MSSQARFVSQLSEAGRVHIDAGVLALHLLGDPSYLDLTRLLFSSLRTGACAAQTSVISIYQIGVEPYRRGEDGLAAKVCTHISALPGLEIIPLSGVIATQAAQVKAQLGGRTERAIQIATALVSDANAYLTQHSGFRRIAGMSVMSLDSFVSKAPAQTPLSAARS
ncbi:MAG: hypothetical protein ABFS14_00990 [Gemmatimonadota bacterium]